MFTMRLLGKRQIGEMQPAELVVTFLLSEVFSIPMQDISIPMTGMIIPVLLIVGYEMLTSVISLKSIKFRHLLQGNSVMLIRDGTLDQKQLKSLRMTNDDLSEALRKKDIFDISAVEYAIVETDGTLSVMPKSAETTVKNKNLNISLRESAFPYVVVSDGRVLSQNLSDAGSDIETLNKLISDNNTEISRIMLMTLDRYGSYYIIGKEDSQ